jgi:endonuclease YncB( thermonuclease family)
MPSPSVRRLLAVLALTVTLTGCSTLSTIDDAAAPHPSAAPTHRTTTPQASRTPSSAPTKAPATARTASAVVVRVVDGDTIVVRSSRGAFTVRFLNVDTPETKKPNTPVQCLGPEASAFTHQLLPKGTDVRLTYDAERLDRYGRDLAIVSTATVPNVSVAIAEAGLGTAVYFAPNGTHLAEVQAAEARARAARIGLFSPTLPCTPGGSAAQESP